MNNNQYNQSYPTTSQPQPVTSKYFGHTGAPGQAGTGLQFNSPADQPQSGHVENMPNPGWNPGGLSGKGGGSQPVGKPGLGGQLQAGHDLTQLGQGGINQQAMPRTTELRTPMSPQDQYNQYAGQVFGNSPDSVYQPNFQNANPQSASDMFNQTSLMQQQSALYDPQPTLGGYATPNTISGAQLTNPGVYSRAQRYSDISY
jgi:hypothetical protein